MFSSFQKPAHSQTSTAFAPDEELAAACLRWWNIALVREKFRLSGIAERLRARPEVEAPAIEVSGDAPGPPVLHQQAPASPDYFGDYE